MNCAIQVEQDIGRSRALAVDDQERIHNLRVIAGQHFATPIKIDRVLKRIPSEKQQLVHWFSQTIEQKNCFLGNSIEQGAIWRPVPCMQRPPALSCNGGTPSIVNANFGHGFDDTILDKMSSSQERQQSVPQLQAERILQSRYPG